ncbi:KV02 protein, partial [Turnix velox]|nr:KV02 protein [Turnix velox]
GQAQVLLKQNQASVTTGITKTAVINCVGEGISNFKNAIIHWYRQRPSEGPQRILFISSGKASYDNESHKDKYRCWKEGTNICKFSVNDIHSSDEGTYFCAYWEY